MRKVFLLSIYLVVFFSISFVFCKNVLAQAGGASVFFVPFSQSVREKDPLSATITLNTNGETISRFYFEVNYPTGLLQIEGIDQSDSVVKIWYQQNISNPGRIILEGGVGGSGANGTQLKIAKLNFQTLKEGTVDLIYASNARVYRESDNVNILVEARSAQYTVFSVTPTPAPTFGGPTPTPGGPTTTPVVVVVTATPTPLISGQISVTLSPGLTVSASPKSSPSPTLTPVIEPDGNSDGGINPILLLVLGLALGLGIAGGVVFFTMRKKNTIKKVETTSSSTLPVNNPTPPSTPTTPPNPVK